MKEFILWITGVVAYNFFWISLLILLGIPLALERFSRKKRDEIQTSD